MLARTAIAILLIAAGIFPAASRAQDRYFFYNPTSAPALLDSIPSDVQAVPFGWTGEAEASRNALLASLGRSVSTLPSVLYRSGTKSTPRWAELRVYDMAQPWSWTAINAVTKPGNGLFILGDSIVSQMAAHLGSMGAPFNTASLNGVSGSTTPQIASRITWVPGNAGIVVLEGGINDYLNGWDSQVLPAYQAMIDALPAWSKVVLVGILPINEALLESVHPGWVSEGWVTNAKAAALRSALAAKCAAVSRCVVFDPGAWTPNTTDGIHLTGADYTALAALLAPYLN